MCYLTAIAGCNVMYIVSETLSRRKWKIIEVLKYFGKNSLYLLCVHIMDFTWKSLWNVENHQFYSAAKRTMMDILIFLLLMNCKKIWEKNNDNRRTKE